MSPRKHPHLLEDWDLFILRHSKTPNVLMHLVSAFLFWASPVMAFFVSPWWLFGFFGSGLVGTAGHFFFKDGIVDAKEATSSAQVVYFSSMMAALFLTGRWSQEISTTRKKYQMYRDGQIESVAHPAMFGKLGKA